MSRLRTTLWTLIRRENDPARIDWAALGYLALYGSIVSLLIVTLIFWMVKFSVWGFDWTIN